MPSNFFDPSAALGGYDQGVSNTMAYDSYLQNYLSQDPSAGMQQPIQPPPEEKPSFMKGLLSNLLSGVTGGMQARTGEMAFAAGVANAQATEQYYKKLQEDEYRKQQEQQLYEMNVWKSNLQNFRTLGELEKNDAQTRQAILEGQLSIYDSQIKSGAQPIARIAVNDEAGKETFLKEHEGALGQFQVAQVGGDLIVFKPAERFSDNEPPLVYRENPNGSLSVVPPGQPVNPTTDYVFPKKGQNTIAFAQQINKFLEAHREQYNKQRELDAKIAHEQAGAVADYANAGESSANATYKNWLRSPEGVAALHKQSGGPAPGTVPEVVNIGVDRTKSQIAQAQKQIDDIDKQLSDPYTQTDETKMQQLRQARSPLVQKINDLNGQIDTMLQPYQVNGPQTPSQPGGNIGPKNPPPIGTPVPNGSGGMKYFAGIDEDGNPLFASTAQEAMQLAGE